MQKRKKDIKNMSPKNIYMDTFQVMNIDKTSLKNPKENGDIYIKCKNLLKLIFN